MKKLNKTLILKIYPFYNGTIPYKSIESYFLPDDSTKEEDYAEYREDDVNQQWVEVKLSKLVFQYKTTNNSYNFETEFLPVKFENKELFKKHINQLINQNTESNIILGENLSISKYDLEHGWEVYTLQEWFDKYEISI